MELRLPQCGMSTFKYPDSFLSLSMPPSAVPAAASDDPMSDLQWGVLGLQEERSWLFYLAEIALQRIMNRILDCFYGKGEYHWITNFEEILKQHMAFKDEIYQWYGSYSG